MDLIPPNPHHPFFIVNIQVAIGGCGEQLEACPCSRNSPPAMPQYWGLDHCSTTLFLWCQALLLLLFLSPCLVVFSIWGHGWRTRCGSMTWSTSSSRSEARVETNTDPGPRGCPPQVLCETEGACMSCLLPSGSWSFCESGIASGTCLLLPAGV